MEELVQRIEIKPEVMSGKPVIKGTRITVEHVLLALAGGSSAVDIVGMHPHITTDDVRAACAYAAMQMRSAAGFP